MHCPQLQRESARGQQILRRVRHGSATCLRGLRACQPATSQVLFGLWVEHRSRPGADNQVDGISRGSGTGCPSRAPPAHRSCSATWWGRARYRRGSIPRSNARWSAPFSPAARARSSGSTALSRSTSATACSPISAIPPRTRTTPSELCAPASPSSMRFARTSPLRALPLQARIGVATGVVVVGDLVREGVTQENAAIGETTNLAARLQSLAEPNTLVISPETHRLVGALFEYRDLGQHTLKGFAEPVHVRQVLGASKLENRFEARHPSGSSALLGRDEELDLLLRRWESSQAWRRPRRAGDRRGGHRQVAAHASLAGASSGRSRIRRSSTTAHPTTRTAPSIRSSASFCARPISSAMKALRPNSTSSKPCLRNRAKTLQRTCPCLQRCSQSRRVERYPLPNLTPQRLKERTLGALVGQLKRLAARTPVLMVFEDLHWIDPTSLELLSLAVDQAPGLRLLIIVTSRPDFTPPWPSHQHISTISLSRLGRSEGQALVQV